MKTILPAHEAGHLLQLDAEDAREALAHVSRQTALNYLSELFRANGWIVSFTDSGVNGALLLSSPKNPQTISLIVEFIVQSHALTYGEAREALMNFENNLSPQYKCSQFAIIALNGIEQKAEKLEQFNLLLQDWSYIQDLIKHYSTGKIKEPRIQLFAHNKQTYKKVCKMMASGVKSIAVVQATGTGKSFLIAKLLQDFSGEKRLVMAPSIYVIEQVKEHIRWDAGKIEFMTYARSMNLSQSEVLALNPKMIVLDEFHRCGAEEWGRGVQNILNAYPNAFTFGTSATPVRYMDNARDMSKEIFGNNVAENLSLAQAIVRNILPMPKYVCALYSLREEVDNLKEKINKSRSTEAAKKKMLLDIDAVSINWELSNGVPAVLKKHLRKNMRKFIVFCRDEEHLFEMEFTVSEWFKKATDDAPIQTYRIFDNEPKSFENLEAFKSADSRTAIHLLFSINMLNEGLHVNEVSGVVLLRPTASPNIFYQQIGRCLKVGLNHAPVIFDLVNNFKSIHSHDFLYDLEFARSQYTAERGEENLKAHCPVFTLMDEVREITEVFGEITFRLDDWEAMYERLVAYKERFGTCDIPAGKDYLKYKSLRQWLINQRLKFRNGFLEPQRQDKLVALGVDLLKSYQPLPPREERWEERFKELCAFREQFGHCNVGDPHKEFNILKKFVAKQRQRYKLGTLEGYRINKLLSIGFEFERKYNEGLWQRRFDELVAYKKVHGHLNVKYKQNSQLGHWVDTQRMNFRENKLDSVRQQKLNSIGFEWTEGRDGKFENRLSKLIAWYHEHRHFKISEKNELYRFVVWLRTKYKRNNLPADVIQRLQAIGFNFEFQEANARVNEKRLQQLHHFVQLHGHSDVTKQNENYEGLSVWLSTQRKFYTSGTLGKDLVKKLEDLEINWNYKHKHTDVKWNSKYTKLVSLYQKAGKKQLANVDENGVLNCWCSYLRKRYKMGKLTEEQIEKLNAIGFEWDFLEARWEENFALLLAYKEKYGHCRVPKTKPETYALYVWCNNVRSDYKSGTLSAERIKKLESVGFMWNITDALWHERYENLREHVNKHTWEGIYRKNLLLAGWVSKQRKSYKQGKLAEEKIMLLNMLGIEWKP
ncbi:MAG: Helicase associated domain protein [Bacteroidota bacterium]|nr:Helicase associated domain protein [Bacteroidota bacterium]